MLQRSITNGKNITFCTTSQPLNLTTFLTQTQTLTHGPKSQPTWEGVTVVFVWKPWSVCMCVCELLSHVWFFVTPWTIVHQAPLSMGFSRQEYWSGLPFPSPWDLPNPRDRTWVPYIIGRFVTICARKPWYLISFFLLLARCWRSPLELWKAEWTKHEELESQVQEEWCKYLWLTSGCRNTLPWTLIRCWVNQLRKSQVLWGPAQRGFCEWCVLAFCVYSF